MSGRQPGGGHHEKSRQGSDNHENTGKQGQARQAARESAEEREREMERTQPEMAPEDRESFRGADHIQRGDGPGARRTSRSSR